VAVHGEIHYSEMPVGLYNVWFFYHCRNRLTGCRESCDENHCTRRELENHVLASRSAVRLLMILAEHYCIYFQKNSYSDTNSFVLCSWIYTLLRYYPLFFSWFMHLLDKWDLFTFFLDSISVNYLSVYFWFGHFYLILLFILSIFIY